MSGIRERDERVSGAQKKFIVDFMEDHPDFARGKLLGGAEGRKTYNLLWEQLTAALNNIGGPKKISTKWQRVWTDMKNKVKKKAAVMERNRSMTGGGPPVEVNWTECDEKCLSLLTQEAILGLEGPEGLPLKSEEVPPLVAIAVAAPVEVPADAPVAAAFGHPVAGPSGFRVNTIYYDEIPTTPSESDGDEEIARPKKRMKRPAAANSTFAELNDPLNTELGDIKNKLDDLIHERRKTNVILIDMASSLRTLCKRLNNNRDK